MVGWLVTLCMGGIDCHMLCIFCVVLGDGGTFVLGVGDAVVNDQIIIFAKPLTCWLDVFAPGNFLLPAVLMWAWGYDDFFVLHLQCRAGCIIVGGGVRLGEYGKYIMHFGFGFGVN
jgi:hypothetical protein